MGKILLVSGSENGKEILSHFVKEIGYDKVIQTQNGNEARRLLNGNDFELIIINTPLIDEFGRDFAIKAADVTNSGIILICRSEISDEVCDKLSCYGIFVLSKPINKNAFIQTLKLAAATRSRMLGLNNEARVQNKTEEIKLINRAKNCLMQYLKFTEPQAHRYIEKQAMDTRQTRKEVAKHILSIYEN